MAIDKPSEAQVDVGGVKQRQRTTRNMSAPVIAVRNMLDKQMQGIAQSLFDKVDDALFDMAENASTNQLQNNYFESMREVRFKRIDIEKTFLNAIHDDFVRLFGGESERIIQESVCGVNISGSASTGAELSLMENDAVEEMVAIDTMVARYEKILVNPLDALEARFAHLAGIDVALIEQGERPNPFAPKRWCTHFSNASRLLSIDIKARIVIFKLFEKNVLAELPHLCKQANEILIRANVLAQFGTDARKPTATRRPARSPRFAASGESQSAVASDTAGGEFGAEFSSLLSGIPQYPVQLNSLWDHIAGGAGAQATPLSRDFSNAIGMLSSVGGPVVSADTLFNVLSTMQHHLSVSGSLAAGNAETDHLVQTPQSVLSSLNETLSSERQNGYSLGSKEREIVTLVSLLFQFVLEDRDVAEPMRIVISRLQVPILKVALKDGAFFSQGAHPARRLVNELVQATIGWTESDEYHKDPLYRSVCGIVDRVLAEYENDPGIFNELLADLKSTLNTEQKRTALKEKRLVDAEQGRDKSEQARAYVDELMESYSWEYIPDFVSEVVRDAWSNWMFLLLLQQGADSDQWKSSKHTLDTLLWSVHAYRNREDRAKMLAELPSMLRALRVGFDGVNFAKAARSQFLEALEQLHMEIMQRDADASVTEEAVESVAEEDVDENLEHVDELAQRDQCDTVTESAAEASDSTLVTPTEDQPVNESAEVIPLEYMEKASQLSVGQWVELTDGDSKKRCRLVAILRNNGKRIFVNRNGVKACEYKVPELAKLLESGEVVLLEDSLLFDRAMTSIICGLRKQKSLAETA